jgi:hypothetical protein
MKNKTNKHFKATLPDELKLKNTVLAAKKPRYIYTEEDLGEGILDAGIPSS